MRKTRDSRIVENIKDSRAKIFNLVVVSIVLALAVNLLASGINEFEFLPAWLYIVLSLCVFLICFIVYKIYELKVTNKTVRISGFFIYKNEKKELMNIPSYKISEDMTRNLKYAFFENKGLKNLWENHELYGFQIDKDQKVRQENSQSSVLLTELIQYCILEKMSIFVEDYFNQTDGKIETKEYDQDELSEIILKNRFIKLFSEPMENRAAFNGKQSSNDTAKDEIVHAYHGGAYYAKFCFHLPKGTKVSYMNSNTLEFNMKNFVFTIKVLFRGFNTVIPVDFYRYYLGYDDYKIENFSDFEFEIVVNVRQKFGSLFKPLRWREYNWIDGFMDKLTDYADEEMFFNKIQWPKLQAEIQIQKNLLTAMKQEQKI